MRSTNWKADERTEVDRLEDKMGYGKTSSESLKGKQPTVFGQARLGRQGSRIALFHISRNSKKHLLWSAFSRY